MTHIRKAVPFALPSILLIKFGLSLTSVFCWLAGPAWAQDGDSWGG